MRIAIAQLNPTVGDIEGNEARIVERIDAARGHGADLVLFSELAIFGYPPKDLVAREGMVARNVAALERIAARCTNVIAVVGYVMPDPTAAGTGRFNAAGVCRDGGVAASYAKTLLPTYDVFDETRYFNPGQSPCVFDLGKGRPAVGVTICEDLWTDLQFDGRRVYGVDPVAQAVAAGAELIVNLSASPFSAGRGVFRETLFARQAKAHGAAVICANQVGGNDDLLFDGASVAIDRNGRIIARAKAFAEDLLLIDLEDPSAGRVEEYPGAVERVCAALILGTRDYVRKCGFSEVVVGLSGGVDSAVTAAIAVEALGADRVFGVAMPSRYSSDHSLEDARGLAKMLGIGLEVVPIEPVHAAMERSLSTLFAGRAVDVTEENIQARIRGDILMALSNKLGRLLLTTGNKSELAVGYCTLYGDMCGGLAVLSDVPKTMVFDLARHLNECPGGLRIPMRSIEKPPSAELRANQTDQDSLPPYALLDEILERYVEHDESVDSIVAKGFDRAVVERVARLVDGNEHKRKQAAVGLRVTSRAFGTGRRMPIAARY
jgi:NAD+ synthase/NAD+ synthase (glutamine-hydrolysing)